MRIFQEEIFGPVVSVTTFKDDAVGNDHDQTAVAKLGFRFSANSY
jgi:acyl-CoA reductase-like NAD-dependent aldehyde dehydrogenase